jgi:hypothetical protein
MSIHVAPRNPQSCESVCASLHFYASDNESRLNQSCLYTAGFNIFHVFLNAASSCICILIVILPQYFLELKVRFCSLIFWFSVLFLDFLSDFDLVLTV